MPTAAEADRATHISQSDSQGGSTEPGEVEPCLTFVICPVPQCRELS